MLCFNTYKPEGSIISTHDNYEYLSSASGLEKAMASGIILEAVALMCDGDFTLHFDLHGIKGIMKKTEVMLCREDEQIKDIAVLTRVGKAVCFKIIGFEEIKGKRVAILSRREAQLECVYNYLSLLSCGDIIQAKVTHLESFGAFLDIGCGIASLLSVDCISVSRISHPRDRISCGMNIYVVIKNIDRDNKRIFVSQRELLGTWEENASRFKAGQTVTGIIRSIESYGVFVELAPNLAGLAEIREDCHFNLNNQIGQLAAVYIKSIIPERMKIKLVIIDICKNDMVHIPQIEYFIDCEKISHINYWKYSPDSSDKIVETLFEAY